MLKVTDKVKYKDGVLFRVRDEKTGNARFLSEQTLCRYIEKGGVVNATVVHRAGSSDFVRLSSGVTNRDFTNICMSEGKLECSNKEIFLARGDFYRKNARPQKPVPATKGVGSQKQSAGHGLTIGELLDGGFDFNCCVAIYDCTGFDGSWNDFSKPTGYAGQCAEGEIYPYHDPAFRSKRVRYITTDKHRIVIEVE